MTRERAGLLLLLLSHGLVFAVSLAMHSRRVDEAALAAGIDVPRQPALRSADRLPREKLRGRFERRLRELEDSQLSAADFSIAKRELFRDWIRHDLQSALDLFFAMKNERHHAFSPAELDEELAEAMTMQPRAVWDWIAQRRWGSQTPEVFEKWSRTMIKDGQIDLVLELLPGAPSFTRSKLVESLCPKATPAQLAKLREYLTGMGDSSGRQAMLTAYAARMVEAAGDDSATLLATEKDPAVRSQLATEWAKRELRHLPVDQAVPALLEVPAEVREDALLELGKSPRTGGFPAAVGVLDSLAAAGLLADPSSPFVGKMIEQTLAAAGDIGWLDADSVREIAAISRPDLRHLALETLGRTMVERGPRDGLLKSAGAIPAGPDRDAFLAVVIDALASEPEFPPDDETAEKRAELRERLMGELGEAGR